MKWPISRMPLSWGFSPPAAAVALLGHCAAFSRAGHGGRRSVAPYASTPPTIRVAIMKLHPIGWHVRRRYDEVARKSHCASAGVASRRAGCARRHAAYSDGRRGCHSPVGRRGARRYPRGTRAGASRRIRSRGRNRGALETLRFMKVRYTARAREDQRTLLAYIESSSPQGASNVARAIHKTIELIGQFPEAGRLAGEKATRVLPVGRYALLDRRTRRRLDCSHPAHRT